MGGVSVKKGSYPSKKENNPDGSPKQIPTLELSIGKSGSFQEVSVYHQSQGTTAAPSPAPSTRTSAPGPTTAMVPGPTVGMAINNAIKIIIETNGYNPDTFSADLILISTKIIRASQYLEKGEVAKEAPKQVDTKQFDSPPARQSAPPPPVEGDDSDVPF